MTALARDLNNEDYEYPSSYSSIGNGSDIFKRINAMLDGTLDLNTACVNNEQAKDTLPKMPHVVSGPHSQQGYHDSQYNTSSYPRFQMFYQSTDQQVFPQYKVDDFSASKQYDQDDYQSNYKPHTHKQQSKDAYCHQNTDMYAVPYSKSLVDTNSTQYKIESMMALAKAQVKETPQKQLRAIRGSPGTSDFSDYDSGTGTPGTPGTSHNETLSPIDQIFGLMSSSQNRQRNRCTSGFDLDLSENSSEGSEAALIDMMNVLKLSTREASSPINDLSKQLFTAQQQQHQHQQQASLQQQHQQQVSLEQQRQQASLQQQQLSFQQHQQAQHQQSLVMYQQAQQAQQQQKNLMMYRQAQQAQQQRQLMAVSQATNPQPALQPTNQLALTGSAESIVYTAPTQVMQPFAIANLDPYAIDRAARLHRSAAAMCEASCTWSGNIPPKNYKNPTTFSCKVFLGGVPWDITEAGLQASFNKFGLFKIEWPGRDGYVYLLFESEKAVRVLLQECIHDYSTGEYFYHISSRRMRSKEVQVIPWMLSESNFIRQPSQRLDANKTVFVGALHGMISAETLSNIMDDLFGNVAYTGIDSDKHRYPIGSGRVTFSSQKSYMKAVQAAFVELKTPKFTKKIQIDPYLEDSICSLCNLQQGPYFCRDLQCFRYFCRTCWYWKHEPDHMRTHKPLSRNTKGQTTVGLM